MHMLVRATLNGLAVGVVASGPPLHTPTTDHHLFNC